MNKEKVSLVTTVLNDYEGCISFLSQIEHQTYTPDELIIVDGGSRDGTWELLSNYQPRKSYQLKVFQEVGCNVARGRNIAIAQSSGRIIVSTDVGCSWENQWLEDLVQPLLQDPELEAVMGSWNVLEEDCKTRWSRVDFSYQRGLVFIATPQSDASSRSIAYRKQLWTRIGGYPEDLTLAGDDMVFSILLHRSTTKIAASALPLCHWKRPQTLKSLIKEARRNFRGAGEAGIWLDYGLLVGLRLVVEIFLLLGSFSFSFFFQLNFLSFLCFVSLIFCIFSRIIKLSRSVQEQWISNRLRGIIDLIIFEYLIKIWSLIGFWEGYFHGQKNCSNCRLSLAIEH